MILYIHHIVLKFAPIKSMYDNLKSTFSHFATLKEVHGKKKFGNVTPKKRTAKEVSNCRNVSAYLG